MIGVVTKLIVTVKTRKRDMVYLFIYFELTFMIEKLIEINLSGLNMYESYIEASISRVKQMRDSLIIWGRRN